MNAALQVYEEAIAARVSAAELDGLARTLLRLQDDPAELLARLPRKEDA